jgi:hypothetical protein
MARVLAEAVTAPGRILVVDILGQGDYMTIQEAINAAQGENPSNTEQWLVLVAPGSYAETLTLYDYVHVAGFAPGPAALVKPSGASAIANGAECTLSNLALSGDSSPVVTTGTSFTGKLRLKNILIEDSEAEIGGLWVRAGKVEIRDSLLQCGGAPVQLTAGTVKIFNSVLRVYHEESFPGFFPYSALFVNGGTIEAYHSLFECASAYGSGIEFVAAPDSGKLQFCTVRQAGGVEAIKVDPIANLDTVYLANILANGVISAKITGMREGLTEDANI